MEERERIFLDESLICVTWLTRRAFDCVIDVTEETARGGGGDGEFFALGDGWPIYYTFSGAFYTLGGDCSTFCGDCLSIGAASLLDFCNCEMSS